MPEQPARWRPGALLALLGVGVALLAATQRWRSGTRVDDAGLTWQVTETAAQAAPAAPALQVVAACCVVLGWGRPARSRRRLHLLALGVLVLATVLVTAAGAGSGAGEPTPWWWVALGSGVVGSAGLLWSLVSNPPEAPRTAPVEGRRSDTVELPEHERARREAHQAWTALTDGADPTAGRRPGAAPRAGTMGDNDRQDPP